MSCPSPPASEEHLADQPKPHVMLVGHLAGGHLFGAERSLLDIVAAIDQRRYDVSCVLPQEDAAYIRAVEQHTRRVRVFPYEWWSKDRVRDDESVTRFERAIEEDLVDLVHVNTMTLMDPLVAARRAGVPSLVHVRELLDDNAPLAEHFGDAAVATIRDAADFVVANSDATHRLFWKKDASVRLYNPIAMEPFDVANSIEPGAVKIGLISSNNPHKGLDTFVRLATMAARRADLEFIVIGPRTAHAEALEQAMRHATPRPNVRFAGYAATPVEAVSQVNVVVSFSEAAESFGRSVAEAMAAGRPVIAYRRGGPVELIRDGREGFLIEPGDMDRVLELLEELADNPERALELGRAGRRRARLLLSPRRFAAGLNGIYDRVLESRRR